MNSTIPFILILVIATMIGKKRRRIISAFRSSASTSPDHAKDLRELGISDSNLFRIQVWRKIICSVENGKYYLDEVKLEQAVQLKRKTAAGFCATAILVALYLFLQR